MLRVVVLVSGGGTNLQALIDSIEDGTVENAEIVGVVSNKNDAYALERAKECNIKGYYVSPKQFDTREEFNIALEKCLDELQADLIVLAGYLVILPPNCIQKYRNRIINVHPSLIPAHCGMGYYGLKVHESVLEKGNKVTGATVHFVNEEADEGPIILQKAVHVEEDDTPQSLQQRVMEKAEWIILPQAVNMIANDEIYVDNNLVKRK